MSTLYISWNKKVANKKSTIVAGLDPKGDFETTEEFKNWCMAYISAVSLHVVAIKPNLAFFLDPEKLQVLKECVTYAKSLDLLVIADSKISDIGSTNQRWVAMFKDFGFDALTIAPYAGNIRETISYAKVADIGVIAMGLMSNPEFLGEATFQKDGEALFEMRTMECLSAGVDGLVLGGTYKKDSQYLQRFLELTKGSDVLYLVPGLGAQGGSITDFFETGVDPDRCMLNFGRELMYEKGKSETEINHDYWNNKSLEYKNLASL